MPMSGEENIEGVNIEGRPAPTPEDFPLADFRSATPGYFEAMGIRLVRGRAFDSRDTEKSPQVAVIDETMVKAYWPNEDPIGKRVRDRSFAEPRPAWVLNAPGRDGWFDVIGVVRDAPNRGLREPIAPAMYYPYTAALSDVAVLLVRTKGSPIAAERELRAAVGRVDANLPIIRFITPETFMGWRQGEFVTSVLVAFGAVSLVLASFGLFSVACYSIAHRTREFGIRIALGATPGAVLRSALQSLGTAVVAGGVVGLVSSVALGSLLTRWSIPSLDDPLVLVGVAVTMLISTIVAILIPARRATSIEPAIALKTE
jgi:hypothetical protein